MSRVNVGQFVQTLANIGVIVGIVFLVFEIRQNSEQLAAQTRFNYVENQSALGRSIVENDSVANAVAKSSSGQQLTPTEEIQLQQLVRQILIAWEYEYSEYEAGRMRYEELRTPGKRQTFQSFPSMPAVWEQFKVGSIPGFAAYVDEELASP